MSQPSHSPIVIIQQTSHDDSRPSTNPNTSTTTSTTTTAADSPSNPTSHPSEPLPETITLAQFTLNDYAMMKRNNHSWFSPPFYTRQQGYRMCLKVMTNGEGSGTGQYVAMYLHLMRGEFDDLLAWPFRGELVVELLCQQKVKDTTTPLHPPHTHALHYTDATPRRHASRVTYEDRATEGKGTPSFIHLSELAIKFLHNDSLVFRIIKYKTENTARRHTHIF